MDGDLSLACYVNSDVPPSHSQPCTAGPQTSFLSLFPDGPSCGLNCTRQKDLLKFWFPMNVTLFGNRVFADVIRLRWGHNWVGWALMLLRRRQFGQRHAEGGWPWKAEAETGVILTSRSGTLKAASNHQVLKKQGRIFHPGLWREQAHTLILDFWSPEGWDNKFLLF